MSQQVQLPKNVDFDKVSFSQVKTHPSGAKSVYMNVNNNPLIIQTPVMKTPFGLSKFVNNEDAYQKGEREKWTLQLALKDFETSTSISNFYKFLKNLDTAIVQAAFENSKAWFNKKQSEDLLKELYSSPLQYPKDKEGEITDKYPPTFRLTVPVIDGKIACDCYNPSHEKVDLSTIDKGSTVVAIIQATGAWIAGSKFGYSFKVIQMLVTPPSNISGFAFITDGDDDHNIPTKNSEMNANYIDTDDEDILDKGCPSVNNDEDVEQPIEHNEVIEEVTPQNSATEKKTTRKKK
jgi:hypothetical protein